MDIICCVGYVKDDSWHERSSVETCDETLTSSSSSYLGYFIPCFRLNKIFVGYFVGVVTLCLDLLTRDKSIRAAS